jgi:hypothetical protein
MREQRSCAHQETQEGAKTMNTWTKFAVSLGLALAMVASAPVAADDDDDNRRWDRKEWVKTERHWDRSQWDRQNWDRSGWGRSDDRQGFFNYALSRRDFWDNPNVDRDRRDNVLRLFFTTLDLDRRANFFGGWRGRNMERQLERFINDLDRNNNGNVSKKELRRYADWLEYQHRYAGR